MKNTQKNPNQQAVSVLEPKKWRGWRGGGGEEGARRVTICSKEILIVMSMQAIL